MGGLGEPLLPAQNGAAARATGAPAAWPGRPVAGVSVLVEEDDGSGCGGDYASDGAPLLSPAGGGGEHAGGTFNVCAFNLTKVILGAGMMAMPKAMYMLGVIPATALMVLIGLLTQYTLARGLVHSSDLLGAKSYGALVRRALGPKAEAVLQAAVFVTCWAMDVVFLVVIGDILIGDAPQYHGLIRELTGHVGGPWASRPVVLGALCAFVLLPLGSMKSMDRLAAVNIIGVASNAVFAALMVVLFYMTRRCGQEYDVPMWPEWRQLVYKKGTAGAILCLASTVPIILNCFACHQSLHPLLPSLRPYSTRRAQRMCAVSLTIAGVLYYTISICACAVFGGSLHDDVLTDISATRMAPLLNSDLAAHAAAMTLRVGYLLSLTGSFVLLLFPLRHVLGDVFLGGRAALASRWLPATLVLEGSIYLTACFLPGIWDALSFVGATAITAQAWIIPALLVLAVDRLPAAAASAAAVVAAAAGGAAAEEGAAGAQAAAAAAEDAGADGKPQRRSSIGNAGGRLAGAPGPEAGGGGAAAEGGGDAAGWTAARAGRTALALVILSIGVLLFSNAVFDAVAKQLRGGAPP